MGIQVPASSLFAKRPAAVRKIISRLRGPQPFACDFLRRMHKGCKVLAAAESLVDCDPEKDLWLRTFVADIWCQYLEHWIPLREGRSYELHQANLHLRMNFPGEREPREIVLLHCEPSLMQEDLKSRCKRGPHVHVADAGHPMVHCHFPLNLCHLESTMESIDALSEAIRSAIEIVRAEVVKGYATEVLGISSGSLPDDLRDVARPTRE